MKLLYKTNGLLFLLFVFELFISSFSYAYVQALQINNKNEKPFLITSKIKSLGEVEWEKVFGPGKAKSAERLFNNQKIFSPHAIVEDFINLKAKTRVIVSLKDPKKDFRLKMMKDKKGQQKIKQAVKNFLNSVISRMDPKEIKSTNRFEYIFGFSAEVTLKGLEQLANNLDVVSIEKDEILRAHTSQGVSLMNASYVRSLYPGTGLSIAICDTGIDYTHPKLGSGTFPNNKVIGGYDCGDDDSDPIDTQGHGTACAGIAAGDVGSTGDYIGGIAPGAKLYAVKISFGKGDSAYASDMIEGWEWCISHQNDDPLNPIMVISTSFGGGRYFGACDSNSPAMTQAAENAGNSGITLFVSSGNNGYCDSVGWPSCISHVNSVGAVYDDAFGNISICISEDSCADKNFTTQCTSGWYATDFTQADMVTSYSNTASILALFAPSNNAATTDIVGSGGYSQGDYVNSFGGTSAACPYAAGSAASLQHAAKALTGSFLTPTQVRSILIETGAPITDTKVAITKPRIDLTAAVNFLVGPPIAGFNALQKELCIGDNATTFQDTSIRSPDSWKWTISPDTITYLNGTTPDSQNPVVRFDSSGDYTVSLYIENELGNDRITKTNFIRVYEICQNIQIDLTTDDYSSETFWYLKNAENDILFSSGPYEDNQNYIENFLLSPGDYTFSIFDSWGDGICCDYGLGEYTLTNINRQETIVSGGAFEFEEHTDFSIIPLSDFDRDGDIDGSDLKEFLDVFVNGLLPDADINSDGVADSEDVKVFATDFGE